VEIAVLLCSYNGEPFIWQQLESIGTQNSVSCKIYVSDDNSTDGTLALIQDWGESENTVPVSIRSGPGQGYSANFLSLLQASDVEGDYFAFADQDDLWDQFKLATAVKALENVPSYKPALYCSRTRSINESGQVIGISPLFGRPAAFKNALIQNIAGGNTMVLNKAAKNLMTTAGQINVVSHDWWCYLLVTGANGAVIYDTEPAVSYRQHNANLIGSNDGFRQRSKRYLGLLRGRNQKWNERNFDALCTAKDLLKDDNKNLLKDFEELRNGTLLVRLSALARGGFYAQTLSGNIGLLVATLLKKI
jgi:glycosyltransferase involved in cell wall biosynthesis